MWLEYTIRTPYNKGEQIIEQSYFEARTEYEAEALWQLRCAAQPRGTVSDIRRVEKPSHQHCEDMVAGLRVKLQKIEEEISRFEGYLNDSSE